MNASIHTTGLPQGVTRNHLIDLVERLMSELGLNLSAVAYLKALAKTTRHDDWNTPGQGPRSYVRQSDLADEMKISRRTARRIEQHLEQIGFITVLRELNNHRSGYSGATGITGVFLAPLIEAYEQLSAMREAQLAEKAALKRARGQLSVARAQLRDAIRNGEYPQRAVAAAEAALDATPSRPSLERDIEEIEKAGVILRAALDGLEASGRACGQAAESNRESAPCQQKMTHARSAGDTRHIHDTSNSDHVICNERAAVPADADSVEPAYAGSRGLEAKPVSEVQESKANVGAGGDRARRQDEGVWDESQAAKTPLSAWMKAATPEFRLYAESAANGQPVRWTDLCFAADMRRKELRVRETGWDSAGAALGFIDRAAAVLILDRNQTHPDTPVRNPGGALVRMIGKDRTGQLNLTASLIGILERENV